MLYSITLLGQTDLSSYSKYPNTNEAPKDAMVFFDLNFAIEEIAEAKKAAEKTGKTLIVIPGMSDETRKTTAENIRAVAKIDERLKLIENEMNDPKTKKTRKAEIEQEKLLLDQKKQPKLNQILAVVRDEKYSLTNTNVPSVLKKLSEDGINAKTMIFSAHSDGQKNNEMTFYGDYNGADTKISRELLIKNIKESNSFKNLDHVYLSSCNSLMEVDALKWMTDLPHLNSCTGYSGKAGKSYYPMVQETIYNDLTQESEFYTSLIDDDLEDKSKIAENYLKQIQENWLGQMNISHSWKDENGIIHYAGVQNGRVISSDINDKINQDKKDACEKKIDEIKDQFSPDFIKLQSQLTMYKLAWTNLVLAGVNKDNSIASVEDNIAKTMKQYHSDPALLSQYQGMLNYKSAANVDWMKQDPNYLPNAMQFLAKNMHTAEFKQKILAVKYPGNQNNHLLTRIENDIKDFGIDYSDIKASQMLADLYKNDPSGNRFLLDIAKQINGAMRGREGLKGIDELYYRNQIKKMKQQFDQLGSNMLDKIKDQCGTSLKEIEKTLATSECSIQANSSFPHLNNILQLQPILDRLNLENFQQVSNSARIKLTNKNSGETTEIGKLYLSVTAPKSECNFTYNDSQLPVISFNNIPSNGEYNIVYIGNSGKSKEQILNELQQMKNVAGYQARNKFFNQYLAKNNIYRKHITADQVKLKGNGSGTSYRFDFDGNNEIDPTKASFDGGSINISKQNTDKFMILSSWGNNDKQIDCKLGKILNNTNNPIRQDKILAQQLLELKRKQEEEARLNDIRLHVAVADNTRVVPPIPYDLIIKRQMDEWKVQNDIKTGRYIAFDKKEEQENYVNQLTPATTIRLYHEQHPQGGWLVVDKNARRLSVYREDGFLEELVDLSFVKSGKDYIDGQGLGTEAGVFTIQRFGSQNGKTPNKIVLDNQRGGTSQTSIQVDGKNNTCQNCFKIDQKSMNLIHAKMKLGYRVYILPEEQANYFTIKNDNLQFTTSAKDLDFGKYNFSPKDKTYKENHTVINSPLDKNGVAVAFMSTLDTEKQTLMKMYNLDNDDYNNLAKLAFGILGNESEFGTGRKLKLKEFSPVGVSIMKGNWFDTSDNSRGLTQIKQIPGQITQHYGIDKGDLMNPHAAAVATLGLLAENLVVLKRLESNHPDITPENRMDYLLYLYMGSSRQIIQGEATPDKNIYISRAKQYADESLEIYQER
jgi:hypothetical protein